MAVILGEVVAKELRLQARRWLAERIVTPQQRRKGPPPSRDRRKDRWL